jgi:ribonuclease-3
VDQGYDASREFVLRVLSAQIADLARNAVVKDPKSALQEAVQARGEAAPSYRTVEEAGSDHSRRFTAEVTVAGNVLGRGAGDRKSQAEQAAAAQALDALERQD